ncbi:MAG: hypothetical protein WDZ52_07060 [Pseudohongiellaceae bacterium]
MTLSALIKKGGLAKAMTATPATIATQEMDNTVTVAPVATVAVAVKPEPLPKLSPGQETAIRAWLAHIEETDSAVIADLLAKCAANPEARAYCLEQAKQVPPAPEPDYTATCAACRYFQRTNHPHLGHCTKGEPEAIAGLWDSDRRYCEQFLTGTKQSTGIQTDTRKDKHEVKTP